MKQILLMRHAKAGWENPLLQDFDRPLSNRGIKDAAATGKFLLNKSYKPGLLISSPAERARQTSTLCMNEAALDANLITWNRQLYYGSVEDYLEAIQAAPDEHQIIMLVGHNPLMESTAGLLAGAASKATIKMPTSALICMETFVTAWKEVKPENCQMKWMVIPEVLGNQTRKTHE